VYDRKTFHYITDHHVRIFLEETVMAAIDDLRAKLAEMREANDALFARIDEDVAELRRKIEDGTVTPEDVASIQAEIDRAKAHDIDKDFPPAPEPEPEPEPTPDA
jgi:molybdopterin converting factor small subunit